MRAAAAAARRSIRLVACFAALLAATASAESLEELLARSEAIYATGRFEEAVAILRARLENPQPDDNLVPVRGTLGDLYLEMAKPELALEQFDSIAAEHPRYARAHYKRGRALEQLARFLEAIDAYALAGEQLYDEAEIRGRIGFNYSLLANLPDTPAADRRRYAELARNSLTRAIQLDPSNHAAMGNLADIHFNLGEFQLALAYYERMDRMQPSRPMTLARIGSTYLKLEQCEPALENLLRAAAILEASQPRTQADAQVHRDVEAVARIRAAECLIALDRASEARSQLSRVLEIAHCPDCATTSREIDRSKMRAEELLLQLDPMPATNAEATR